MKRACSEISSVESSSTWGAYYWDAQYREGPNDPYTGAWRDPHNHGIVLSRDPDDQRYSTQKVLAFNHTHAFNIVTRLVPVGNLLDRTTFRKIANRHAIRLRIECAVTDQMICNAG